MTATPQASAIALPVIRHGGNLAEAIRRHGGSAEDWLDLSTGINPHGYPVPALPAACWQRLPEDDDGLAELAAQVYRAPRALPVAGSQAAIRALPGLLRPGRVGIAALGYSEYAPAFARAGHEVVLLDEAAFLDPRLADRLDHLVVVNPNNPTGRRIERQRLLDWHAVLRAHGGTLVVDEAFADADADGGARMSLAPDSGAPGLVVLRSLGKFFGLAGVRCGFVLASADCLAALGTALGHWTVSGPGRAIARIALADSRWQASTRQRLANASARLDALLRHHGLVPVTLPLFCWLPHADAPVLHRRLAAAGIWSRLFDAPEAGHGNHPPSLRLGLPPDDETAWQRLDAALSRCLTT